MEESLSMGKIPKTDSIEELAKFWDSHDITEFEDELEEAGEPVFDQDAQAVVRIHLPSEQAKALRRMAESRGIDEAALVQEWVNEKLRAS